MEGVVQTLKYTLFFILISHMNTSLQNIHWYRIIFVMRNNLRKLFTMPQAIHKNAYISFTDISIPVLIFMIWVFFFLLTFVFFPFKVLICIYIMRYLTFSFALRHFFIVFHLLTIAFENSTCTVYCFQNKLSSVTAESI